MRKTISIRRPQRRGFTLIEVLLVIAILGVIAAAVVPQLMGTQKRALIANSKNNVKSLEHTLTLYATDHDGEYPSGSKDALTALTQSSEYRGRKFDAYLDEVPKDSWGEPLNYEYPSSKTKNGKPAIWSSGPNHQNEDGAGDDINNWSEN